MVSYATSLLYKLHKLNDFELKSHVSQELDLLEQVEQDSECLGGHAADARDY